MQIIPIDPIHPGDILREDFFHEFGLSAERAARDIGIDPARIEAVLGAKAAIDADLALRLSRYFGNSAEFWLNLQRSYDLSLARAAAGDLSAIKPVQAA